MTPLLFIVDNIHDLLNVNLEGSILCIADDTTRNT